MKEDMPNHQTLKLGTKLYTNKKGGGDKFTTKFELEPYTVTERQGTKIVAEKLKTQDNKECFVL